MISINKVLFYKDFKLLKSINIDGEDFSIVEIEFLNGNFCKGLINHCFDFIGLAMIGNHHHPALFETKYLVISPEENLIIEVHPQADSYKNLKNFFKDFSSSLDDFCELNQYLFDSARHNFSNSVVKQTFEVLTVVTDQKCSSFG